MPGGSFSFALGSRVSGSQSGSRPGCSLPLALQEKSTGKEFTILVLVEPGALEVEELTASYRVTDEVVILSVRHDAQSS